MYTYYISYIYIYIAHKGHIPRPATYLEAVWQPAGAVRPGARAIFFAFNVALAAIFGWASCPSWEVDDPKNYSITADILHIYIYLYIYIYMYMYTIGVPPTY